MLVKIIAYINRWYVHRFVYISHHAKCPGCGSRHYHDFIYHPDFECVLHRCAECKAPWSEPCVVQVGAWKVKDVERVDDRTEPMPANWQTVTRSPIVLKQQ